MTMQMQSTLPMPSTSLDSNQLDRGTANADYKASHRVSPPALINSLPPEILTQILECVLADQQVMVPQSHGRTNVAFYNVEAVCRYWREIGTGHWLTWSSLNIVLEAKCSPHHIDYLGALLKGFRGSNLPVEIYSKSKGPVDLSLLDVLLEHSERISRLDVKSTHIAVLERLNSRKGHFSSLSCVNISIAHHPDFNMEWTAFEMAPSLRSLSLVGGALIANGARSWYEWNLPYHTLKRLSVRSIRAEDGCHALSAAPSLEELHVAGYFYTDGPDSAPLLTRPDLPALHTYKFEPDCDSYDDLIPELSARIATNLTAPNLQVLRCHADHFQYFASMCKSSQCSLKTLALRPINAQNENNVKIISSFIATATTLETLELFYTDPISGDGETANPEAYTIPLTALFHPETGAPTLPHLHTLHVKDVLMTEGVNCCLKRILANYKGLQRLVVDFISASRYYQFLDYPSQPMITPEQVRYWDEFVSTMQALAQTKKIDAVMSFTDGYDFHKFIRLCTSTPCNV